MKLHSIERMHAAKQKIALIDKVLGTGGQLVGLDELRLLLVLMFPFVSTLPCQVVIAFPDREKTNWHF